MTIGRRATAILLKENVTANFIGACASGVCVGAAMEDVVNSGFFQLETFIEFAVVAAGSYVLVALFFYRSMVTSEYVTPRWILIAIVGSIMSSATGILGAQWSNMFTYLVERHAPDILGALGSHLIPVMFLLILNSLIAGVISLPTMFLSHLFGVAVRRAFVSQR